MFYFKSATVDVKLNNDISDGEDDSSKLYYIFNTVDVTNLGWMGKSGSNYTYGSVTLRFSFNGTSWQISLVDAKNSSGTAKSVSSLGLNLRWLDGHTKFSSSTQFVLNKEFYVSAYNDTQAASETLFNIFKITDVGDTWLKFEVRKVGICGAWFTSSKTDPVNTKDETHSTFIVNSNTATGNTVGFTVNATARSNYTPQDTFEFGSGSNALGSVLATNAQPVKALVNTDTDTTETCFWINNVRYVLGSNDAGYYKKGTGNTFNKQTSSLPSTTTGFKDNYIYFDGTYVYYSTKYINKTSSTTTSTTYKTNSANNEVNFNNTQIVAIRPEQYYAYNSTGAYSASLMNGTGGNPTYYEMTSYLSAISIGSTTYKLNLYRNNTISTVGANTAAGYSDFNFLHSDNNDKATYLDFVGGSLTTFNIKYFGVDYKVYCAYYFAVSSGREFVLYLTRNETNHEVMYFLYSDVYSEQTKADGGADNETIRFTFTEFDKDLTLSLTTNDDVFSNKDNPLVYRYSYLNSKFDTDYAFNSSNFTLSEGSDSSTAVSYFGKTTTNKYQKIDSAIVYDLNPTDYLVFELQPTDGYIIKNLKVEVGGQTLFNFAYNSSAVEKQPSQYYSYYINTTMATGGEARLPNFVYSGGSSKYFYSDAKNATNKAGVMYTQFNDKAARTWVETYDSVYMNPVWIMVSGMYDDVSISVETMSYVELYFEFDVGSLSSAVNANNLLTEHITILTDHNVDDSWDKVLPVNDSTIGDRIFVKSETGNSYRIVFEGQAKSSLFAGGIKFLASGNSYPYSNSYYFTEGKLYSDNTGHGVDGSTTKGMFFENLEYVKVGSNLTGDDFTGRTSLGESLYNNALISSTGAANNIIALTSKTMTYNDFATYIYIRDVRRVSSRSGDVTSTVRNYDLTTYTNIQDHTKDGADTGTEFSNKYFFYVKVKVNATTYGVNSYLYNSNLDTTQEKPYEANIFNNTVNSVDVYKPTDKDLEVGMIARILTSDGQAVSNNLLSLKIIEIQPFTYGENELLKIKFSSNMTGVTANQFLGKNYKLQFTKYYYSAQSTSSNLLQYYYDENTNWQWIYTSNGLECYQLDFVGKFVSTGDNYTKIGSWFNDTILTNIEYGFNSTFVNWQNVGAGNNFSNTQYAAGNASGSTYSGVGITYKYYEIPGYYLKYIEFDTIDFGRVYINVADITPKQKNNTLSGKLFGSGSVDTGYYYKLTYNKTEGLFTLNLFASTSSTYDCVDSIGFTSNSFDVNFYSYPYKYEIQLSENTGESTSKDYLEKFSSNGTDGRMTQSILYDNLTYIDTYLTMPGYTFIGWGSPSYYADGSMSSRYVDDDTMIACQHNVDCNHIWNTTSYWKSMKSEFASSNRTALLEWKDNYETYQSDFYVKSSLASNASMTAYFITDTGFTESAYGSVENYNFWSSYAREFVNTIGAYNPSATKAVFNLVGIWKANTYTLQFNVNDSTVDNGSTNAKLNIAGSGDAAKRILNETTASFDDEFKENYISFDISTTSNDNTTFYCYVRFDSMDWYITTTPASDINRLFSAKSNELTTRNLFDVVVDRYGYSWLGWFSKDETDIKEGDNRDTIVDNRIFASNYYNVLKTTFVDSDSEASTLTFNYNLFNEFVANGSISESYSEFVYDGQHVVDTTKPSKYVYFYQYKTGVANAQVGELSGCYINTDYLNNFTSGNYNNTADVKKKYLTYFDTSLTYRCYSIDASDVVSITRSLAENAPQIKYLKLYAYWQINFYEFVIDWQDSEGVISQDTLNIYGSSPAGILQENGDIVKESFDGAYFDDYALSDRLNNFTPVRVGYDFLGWAYYYDLTKTNENQLISEHVVVDRQDTTMWLCRELTTYYGEFAANGFDNVPLYTTSGLLQSGYNSSLFSAQETFGVDSGENFVYIFAIWKAQTFTINVDLSIDYEELENLYEKDSRFAVALYKNAVNNINYDAYTGIRTSYYKQNASDYTELVANLNFVITFDKDFTEAYCEIIENGGVNAVTSTYKLTNLFATSTGYYFLGWLYNPELPSNMLVYNTLKSTFGTNGTAVNNVNGLGESKLSTDNPTFNLAMYENLYNTDYKDFDNPLYTGTEFFDPATNDNIKKLSTIDTHGASSNFGYINFNGEKCYIACDDAEVSGKHALYFKYNGLKYYVVIYNDTAENVLTNDHSFLYYEMNGIKYKVRYDIDGDPYIVTTNYGARNETSINLNLKIAAFETYSENNASMINFRQENSEGRIVGNLFEYDPPNQKYKFYYYPENSSVFVNGAEFVSETTRQFTLYAHWGNKNDLYFEIKNDSNSKVDGEYTYYSNPGLAGFYDVETYNEFERVDTNYNLNFAGHQHFVSDDASGSVAFGVDRFNFNYYDDLKLNILPFFNGRYLSEMKLTFYGIEETVLNTNEDKGQMHSVFKYTKYTLEFKFEWDAENHRIVIRTTNGIILRVNDGEATQYTFNGTFGKFDGSTETSDYYSLNHIKLANVTPLDKLSLLDKDLGGETFIAYILRMFEYSNGTESNERHETYGRTDVNKLSFDMEDIMTNIEISCKFSVQTYNVEFYSVLDKQTSDGVSDRGNLQLQSGTTNKYITNFASKSEFEANVADNNDVGASGTYLSRNAYTETKIATIPDDCSASTKLQDVTNFNIPYGYFLYGEFFTYSKYPNRPIDEASNVALLNNDLYGFEYIYSNGYYNYGTTTLKLKINDDDPTDSFVAQCAPILGPSYRFGNQAKGFRKEGLSFYTFGGWYQYDKTQTDKVVFVQYDRTAEATFISKNMVLYGYYYPINTPKSIDFYTWDDENKSYKVYTGNQGQYTLNANTETSGFKTDNNGYLYLNNQNSEFIDQNGVAKIQNYNIYGVNASGFSNDAFTSVWTNNIIYDDDGVTILDTYEIAQDFAQDNLTDQTILNSLIQTYWYYQESYKVLYFNDGSETHFVKYSQANQSFYFGDDPDQNKVKILSSDDNMETFTVILADGTEYEIHSTIIYRQNESLDESDYLTGNSDAEDAYNFKGAHLYVKETANLTDEITTNDIDRYYRIYEVSTEDYQAAVNGTYADECEGDLISNYNPRYWYEANGVKYFMMARNENNMKLSANTIYTATVNASGENTVIIDTTNNISVIKNYYVKYGVDYYPIKYKVYTDENGSEYISPMNDLTTNQVTVPLDVNNTELFYFDYNTRYLYERTENGQYVRVSFEHYIYCPINENYQVNTEVEKGSGNWTTGAITIKSLPSPNIGFWYDGDNYGFVGYIMVTNTMIEELKAPPSNEGDMGGEIYQRFIAYINAVYSKEAFDIVNFVDYDASTGTSALYQQFLAEYDTTGSGSLDLAHKGFVNTLTDHVTGRIAEYKIESHFIKNLLLAEEYEFEELASGEIIISGVKVNIPITFRDLMIDPRTNSQLTISLTVMPIKSFSVVSTNTSVDTNIHAIPIYSPYAMKFKNDALGGDDSQLVVDVEKMDVWHFELGSYSSYAYNKANGDLLNFVLLNKAQYTELVKNKENIAEKLSTIIKSMTSVERDAYITTENREVLATNTVSVDLSTCQEMNEYVVLAYYYKAGTTTTTGEYTSSSYVVRVSDNVVHLTFGTLGMSKEITTIDKL